MIAFGVVIEASMPWKPPLIDKLLNDVSHQHPFGVGDVGWFHL